MYFGTNLLSMYNNGRGEEKKLQRNSHLRMSKGLFGFLFFITHHSSLNFCYSSLITHHSSLTTHHPKYPNFPNPTRLAHNFSFSSLKIFYCLWDPLPEHMSVSIVSLPASLNSFHFIFFSFSHHCPVTLPTQT